MLSELARRWFPVIFEILLWLLLIGCAISGCVFGAIGGGLVIDGSAGSILGGIVGTIVGVITGMLNVIFWGGLIALFLEMADNQRVIREMTGNIRSHEIGEKFRLFREMSDILRSHTTDRIRKDDLAHLQKQDVPSLINMINRLVSANANKSHEPLYTNSVSDIRNEQRKCPFCAETIRNEAVFCRFCRNSLTGMGT